MTTDSQVSDLLLRWEELRKRGEPVSAEELCRDCPDLLPELQRRIKHLEDLDSLLRSTAIPRATAGPVAPPAEPVKELDGLRPGSEPAPGYRLVQRLGRGGFGEVWKAEAPGGFLVALKLVALGEHPAAVEQRSLDILKVLRHPNLLLTFGAWQTGGYLVVAMELGDCTLWDRHREARAQGQSGIPRGELLAYMREVAQGLDYLHEPRHTIEGKTGVSVQHRDIKPQNILLVGRSVKLGDFGLARLLECTVASHTGSLTPAYAAPEFFRGQTSNHSDQYCLAATYCHLRGGKPPFTGEAAHVMAGHLTESPDLSMIPAEERPALARALAKEPAQRWPSCQAFVEALTQSTLDRTLPSIPSPPVASRSSRRPAMIGAAALLAGLIGLGWFFKDQIIAHGDKKTGELSVATGPGSQDVPKNGQDGGKNPIRNGAEAKSPPQQENTKAAEAKLPDKDDGKFVETAPAPKPERKETEPAEKPAPAGNKPKTTPPKPAPLRELTLEGHSDAVTSVAFSPQGNGLVSGSDDKTIRLWDSETGEQKGIFSGHDEGIRSVAISAKGDKILSGSADTTVRLWDVATKEVKIMRGHQEPVTCVAFLPDGVRAVSGSDDGTVRLWNLVTGKQLGVAGELEAAIWTVACSPEKPLVLFSGYDKKVREWNPDTGMERVCFQGHEDGVYCVRFCPNGVHAVSSSGDYKGAKDHTIRHWRIADAKEEHVFRGHQGAVFCVACDALGQRLLSGSVDRTVRLWNLRTGKETKSFKGHTDAILSVAFSPGGHRAASGGKDKTVRLWNLPE